MIGSVLWVIQSLAMTAGIVYAFVLFLPWSLALIPMAALWVRWAKKELKHDMATYHERLEAKRKARAERRRQERADSGTGKPPS